MVNTGNPFVGPRPLGPGDSIFGRDREIRELRSLLCTERIVLLCSPSGAGKSSLISAGLIPQLTPRFDVWLPTRVNLAPPKALTVLNRYTWSAVAGFEQELPEKLRRPLESFAGLTLKDYVEGRPRRRGAPKSVVLVFDQFEEILRTDPVGISEKREFFQQLGDLLADSNVWALFALREDYLAAFDPYCTIVPTYLRYRYRIDLLGLDSAEEAVKKPAAGSGKEFSNEAIEKLLADLSAVRVQQPDGTFQPAKGLYVEPLQLQVVCRGLWERLPEGTSKILIEHVEKFADASKALAEYYAGELARIAGGVAPRERVVREWIEQKLITRDGLRSLVMRGAGSSEGLDNDLVGQLVDTHLVRGEQRAGTVWYELAHDRLVDPIRQNNATWCESHLVPVQKVAALWAQQNKPAGLLLSGTALHDSKRWANENPETVTSVETEFLAASEGKRRAERNLRIFAATVAVLLVVAVFAAGWALHQTRLSRSRELAARAMTEARGVSPLARQDGLILALGAMNVSATPEAVSALDLAWQEYRGARFIGHLGAVNSLYWSRDGKYLVTGGADGAVYLWNTSTGERVKSLLQLNNNLGVEGVEFSADGAIAAAASDDGLVRVLNPASPAHPTVFDGCDKAPATGVAFGGAGALLGVSCGNGEGVVWNVTSSQKAHVLRGHAGAMSAIRFSPADRLAATGGVDGKVIFWNIGTGRSVAHFESAGAVTSLQFSRDGKWLAGTRLNNVAGKLFLWNTRTRTKQFETIADGNGAFSVDFNVDGSSLATGGLNGDVKLWQTERGQPYLTLFNAGCDTGGDCRARVAFDPVGNRIAIASGDKIWLHELDFEGVRRNAIAELTKRPNIQETCRRVLQADSCPGF